ncbi:phage tail protein [Candidatus Pacearchaeota archaeon]|nr:phage tail protein [Candidatus Pacearchaeota archaeon]
MAIDASAVARVVGIDTVFKNLRGESILFLPQRVAVIGQGTTLAVYSTTKRQVTSANEAATIYGFGSPIHLAVLQLLPVNGDGVGTIPVTIYPLDDDGAGVVSTGDITPSGAPTATASIKVRVNNIDSEEFVISSVDTVATIVTAMTAAINAVLEMPVIAVDGTTKLDFTSKWKGTSANDIFVEVIESTDPGIAFAITQPVGGLVNPDVDDSLNQIGNVWETMVLNCMDLADTTTLGKYDVFGEGRWGELVRKPLIVFTGITATTVAAATAVSDARTTDRTNSQLVAPGSNDLPFVTAARQLARIAVVANNNPPRDYGSQDATGLTPGADGDQWNFADRDEAIRKGSSSIVVKDGVVNVADVVTFYHPLGDPTPAYRYVVDIVKLQQIIFNLDLIFATAEWDGAPLIPDDQPTTNPAAKKPKSAVAVIAGMLDSLGLNAIISDPATAKTATTAEIDSGNPKRLNVEVTVQLSGNTNIINITLNFGFFFGVQSVIA